MTTFTDAMWDDLVKMHSFHGGDTNAGLHDESRRDEIIATIDAIGKLRSADEPGSLLPGLRWSLSRYVRDHMLDEKSLEEGYGWEDVFSFLDWIQSGDYRR